MIDGFSYWSGDESGNVVPVTFLIPNSLIESDLGTIIRTQLRLYNKYAGATR